MICNKCNSLKNEDQFKRGKICIECVKENAREYSKNYRKVNSEKVRIANNKYNEEHREEIRLRDKNKLINPETGDRIRERARINYEKYKEDPSIRIMHNTRTKITKVLKGISKSVKTHELLGCDSQFLKNWLEYQFDSKMSWDNYGEYWHIDHVIPCDSFELNNEELKKCFNWKI